MNGLTDRYIATVVRSIPRGKRSDIERELHDIIAEEIGAVGHGVDDLAAERQVLTSLGSPDVLAARYSDRRWSPVGPRHYGAYIRSLTLVLWIAMPLAFLGAFCATLLRRDDLPYVLGAATSTALLAGLLAAVIVTASYFLKDRRDEAETATAVVWTPDSLTATGEAQSPRPAPAVVTIVVLSILGLFIVAQQFASVVHDEGGDPIPFLNPQLWAFGLPALLALLVLQIARNVVLFLAPRFTRPLAWVNLVIQAGSVAIAVMLLAAGEFINPTYLDALGVDGGSAVSWGLGVIAALVIVVIAVIDIIAVLVRAYRN